ncbi:glycosyltransferase [Carnobacterium funditum]|uniref:glycosyltransferase n=1 Tax=Carnobacterium funditum TaxID=2752 RepID=UPI000551FD77|nr:glycosyltransferase [Carnobacterium funditum]
MKKVVFVIRRLANAGTEQSLIKLINTIENYDITIMLAREDKTLLPQINKEIKIIELYEQGLGLNMGLYLKRSLKTVNLSKFLFMFSRLYKYIKLDQFEQLNDHLLTSYEVQEEKYDLAIAFDGGSRNTLTPFVIEKIEAEKKIMWIQEDYSKVSENEKMVGHKIFPKFDQIFCVSQAAKEKFSEIYPELGEKTSSFYPIFDTKEYLEKAEESEDIFDYNGIKILTVGRLEEEKGQERLPGIVSRLKTENYQFKWFLVGDGQLRKKLEKDIKELGIEDYLILLGKKSNPFPYYKQCDIYVQPSRQEGYCLSMAEANSFKKPLIATNFITSKEFIVHGVDGLIADNNSQSIYKNIKKLLDDENLRMAFSENSQNKIVDTFSEMNKFYAL